MCTATSLACQRSKGFCDRGRADLDPKVRVPAAQYVRASTERQQYSIEYQSKIIGQYAETNGFEIVRTFSDEARSGLDLKYRPALRQLLAEVMGGHTAYHAILVFDVSRWGRFQDTDQAAHYEYLCKSSGIPIHYCAEQFANSGAVSDSLLKTLRRYMAGEYSRDLSARVSGALNQLVQKGFKYGSVPGYGLRRMLVDASGRPKQLLSPGEVKNIASDRVIFVPGPEEERAIVRRIFYEFVEERKTIRDITRHLNAQQVQCTGGTQWTFDVVKRILHHPKYTGTLIFNRTEKKLHNRQRFNPPAKWVVVPKAFEAIVDMNTFSRAQERFASYPRKKSDEELIEDIRRFLAKAGKLSLPLLRQTRLRKSLGLACPATYFKRLGTFSRMCQLAGYSPSKVVECQKQSNDTRKLLMRALLMRFPEELRVPKGKDKYLLVDDEISVIVRICRSYRIKAGRRWTLRGCDGTSMTLAAVMNEQNTEIENVFVLPQIPAGRFWFGPDSDLLRGGIRLDELSNFCSAIKAFRKR